MNSPSTLEKPTAPRAAPTAPAPAAQPAKPAAAPSRKSRIGIGLFLGFFGLFVVLHLVGLPYFLSPAAVRVRSPLHPWFRPSGIIGQAAGIAAFVLFMFLWLYPLQKRFRRLKFGGCLANWLIAHVIAGMYIPVLGTLHAAWQFTGLIGLGYGTMLIAWLSGLVGRYIYIHVPRSVNGVALTREEVDSERKAVLQQLVDATGVEAELLEHVLHAGSEKTISPNLNPLRAFGVMIADDVRRRRTARELRWNWRGASTAERTSEHEARAAFQQLMRREIALSQQARMLGASQRLLRFWHVAHKPMAIIALVAVAIHVATAIALGVTWFH